MRTVLLVALAAALCGCRERGAAQRPHATPPAAEPFGPSSPGAAPDAAAPVCVLDNGCVLAPCGCACRAFPRGVAAECAPCADAGATCEGRRAVCHKGRCVAVRAP